MLNNTNNSSSNCQIIYPITRLCSGNGQCLDDRCYCDINWTSLGDFTPQNYLNCDISKTVVIYGAYVGFLIQFNCIILVSRYLIINLKIRQNKTNIIFPCLCLLHSLCIILYSLGKIINQDVYIIGGNVLYTALYCLIWISGIIAIGLYFDINVKFLRRYLRYMNESSRFKVQYMLRLYDVYGQKLYYVIAIIVGVIPLLGLTLPVDQYYIIGMIYHILKAIAYIAFTPVFIIILSSVRQELTNTFFHRNSQSLDNITLERVNKLCESLRNVTIYLCIIQPFNISMILIFGSWYFIFRKSVYLTLFQNIQSPLILVPMLLSFNDSNETTSSYRVVPVHSITSHVLTNNQGLSSPQLQSQDSLMRNETTL